MKKLLVINFLISILALKNIFNKKRETSGVNFMEPKKFLRQKTKKISFLSILIPKLL